jgi:hypothetical protein
MAAPLPKGGRGPPKLCCTALPPNDGRGWELLIHPDAFPAGALPNEVVPKVELPKDGEPKLGAADPNGFPAPEKAVLDGFDKGGVPACCCEPKGPGAVLLCGGAPNAEFRELPPYGVAHGFIDDRGAEAPPRPDCGVPPPPNIGLLIVGN